MSSNLLSRDLKVSCQELVAEPAILLPGAAGVRSGGVGYAHDVQQGCRPAEAKREVAFRKPRAEGSGRMTEEDLLRLIETQTVERKSTLGEKREALESLDAMINAETAAGAVLFGVAPDGKVVGIEQGNADTAQMSLAAHIRQKFSPAITFEIHALEHDGRRVLVLQGKRDHSVPLVEYDGRAYLREGSANRQLALPEKLQIIRRRDRAQHPGPWRCDRCGSWVGQLISYEISDLGMTRTYSCGCGGEYWPAI